MKNAIKMGSIVFYIITWAINIKQSTRELCNVHAFQTQSHFRNFQKYLKKCTDGVVSFSNLGKDAILIVPCHLAHESPNPYTHLANFIRLGNERQIKSFWQEVARQMQKRLRVKQGKKVWISTCGLGVFWLHVRLDTSPKYYSYTAYRNA